MWSEGDDRGRLSPPPSLPPLCSGAGQVGDVACPCLAWLMSLMATCSCDTYRVLEVLSHHKTLYRVTLLAHLLVVVTKAVFCTQFFPSLVHGYLASSQKGLVHEEVKVHSGGNSCPLSEVSLYFPCVFPCPLLGDFPLVSLMPACFPQVPVESGVCYLLQQCAAPQLAFLKASLDPSSRQALLSLTQHFHTAFKFANKI